MKNEISRRTKLNQLLDRRALQFPNESYDARFNAVVASDAGLELLAQMHIANEDAVLVQSPRHAALLGRLYPIPDTEFRKLWLAKFGPISGVGPKSTSYPSSYPSEEETRRKTAEAAGGSFQGDAKLKDEARRKFLAEVARLMAEGRSRDQAWAEASSTSPGKEFYAQWARGAAQVKQSA